MVAALRRFGRRSLIVRLGYGAFAFACASMLAGCDLLLTMLPQGGANAAFAYADPRLEKSVRIKGLNEVFNLAVAPDGRVFAIARDGVAEYTADLEHVRTYLINDPEGIDKSEDGYGPQEWQVTTTSENFIRLSGSRASTMLILVPTGNLLVPLPSIKSYYTITREGSAYATASIIETDWSPPDFSIGTSLPEDFSPFPLQSLHFDSMTEELFILRILTESEVEHNARDYSVWLSSYLDLWGTPALSSLYLPIQIPRVQSDYIGQRLYVRPNTVALVMGQDSYIRDVRSSTLIYDRALGGEPIARFDMRGAITAASDTALYAVTSDHDEKGGWIHKLRFRP